MGSASIQLLLYHPTSAPRQILSQIIDNLFAAPVEMENLFFYAMISLPPPSPNDRDGFVSYISAEIFSQTFHATCATTSSRLTMFGLHAKLYQVSLTCPNPLSFFAVKPCGKRAENVENVSGRRWYLGQIEKVSSPLHSRAEQSTTGF